MRILDNIITIDGPSGVGKGTSAMSLAKKLHWNYLNSGSLYRILAYLSGQQKIEDSNTEALVNLTKNLSVEFEINNNELVVILDDKNISNMIQTEDCAKKSFNHRFQQYRQKIIAKNSKNVLQRTRSSS